MSPGSFFCFNPMSSNSGHGIETDDQEEPCVSQGLCRAQEFKNNVSAFTAEVLCGYPGTHSTWRKAGKQRRGSTLRFTMLRDLWCLRWHLGNQPLVQTPAGKSELGTEIRAGYSSGWICGAKAAACNPPGGGGHGTLPPLGLQE